jgi:hypothetical protein
VQSRVDAASSTTGLCCEAKASNLETRFELEGVERPSLNCEPEKTAKAWRIVACETATSWRFSRLTFQTHLRQTVAQRVSGESQNPGGVAFVTFRALQRFANNGLLEFI